MTRVIGITGSIAVGKSTVTQYLLTHGYCVEDADKISHQALNKGTSCYEKVIEKFDCLNEDGTINRQKLGQIVFHNKDKKQDLENIIHPYVIETMQKRIDQYQGKLIFLDIPLLFESHLEFMCDKIIVVYVDEQTQIQRLMKRNHITQDEAVHLMKQQISIEKKKILGDYIIDNRLNYEDLYKNIEKVLEVLKDETIYE
ncbi:dephospho-CoA kinase [Candidatus Stoquefichus massiliensis]|uniref:dephospho-CoA kinase n=1 Tax=Candidatus Stoquefichus massiliensis TaxID=1470350 RepID=UPI000488AA85|nr:dephospho-CoA kinase [Candidatus Stoquefichus massiliensis]